ncbi:MAG: transcription antitermination factor NusB [Roseburia sp.]|nr:transcription antitermination factor NusB [Roseburia sp.]
MTRRQIREQIFQILFRAEFHPKEEFKEQMELAIRKENATEEDIIYIEKKSEDIAEKIEQIDEMINSRAKGWKTSRMGKVDVTLLRLAVYEISFEEDIPLGVAINEAVELAKKYGTDDSPAFINGVLSKFA